MIKIELQREDLFFYALALYFIILPMGVIDVGGLGSFLKIYGILLVVFFVVSWRFVSFRGKIVRAQIFLVLMMIFSGILSVDRNSVVSRTSSNILLLIMMMLCSSAQFSNKQIKKLQYCQAWSSRITVFLLFYYGTYSTQWHRLLLLDNTPIIEDPNYLCAYFTFGISYALNKLLCSSGWKNKLTAICEIMVYIVAVILNGSRSGMICLMATVVTLFLMTKLSRYNILIKSIVLVFTLAIIIYTVNIIPENYLSRFTVDSMTADGGSGRIGIWENGLKVFCESDLYAKLFGQGAGSILRIFEINDMRVIVMHNMLLEMLLEIGIIGMCIYILVILRAILVSYKSNNIMCLGVIMGMFSFSMMSSIYTFKPYWNILMLACCLESQQIWKRIE